jgi:hypothetical protein
MPADFAAPCQDGTVQRIGKTKDKGLAGPPIASWMGIATPKQWSPKNLLLGKLLLLMQR